MESSRESASQRGFWTPISMDLTGFPLTRAGAQARLDEFVAGAAPSYGARRSFVDATGSHLAVSRLSGALRRRLISEAEVVGAVLAVHPYEAVEKFIAEVFWRTYWKGWLELHRGMWPQFRQEARAEAARLDDAGPAKVGLYSLAVAGQTGIEAFDHWAAELVRTGYLHNWARMQVASIWTFTLGLPWQLGAEWMFEHLLDADPASNTLSWRWVAGLHTAGKTYLADEARITSMTGGALTAKGLAKSVPIPPSSPPPDRTELRLPDLPVLDAPSLVMLTCDDLSLETELDLDQVKGIIIPCDLAMSAADRIAVADAKSRAILRWHDVPCVEADFADLAATARDLGCTQIVTGFTPTGPVADGLDNVRVSLAASDITLAEHQRNWDRLAWPFCAKGFFQLKSCIPALLRNQGILDKT